MRCCHCGWTGDDDDDNDWLTDGVWREFECERNTISKMEIKRIGNRLSGNCRATSNTMNARWARRRRNERNRRIKLTKTVNLVYDDDDADDDKTKFMPNKSFCLNRKSQTLSGAIRFRCRHFWMQHENADIRNQQQNKWLELGTGGS